MSSSGLASRHSLTLTALGSASNGSADCSSGESHFRGEAAENQPAFKKIIPCRYYRRSAEGFIKLLLHRELWRIDVLGRHAVGVGRPWQGAPLPSVDEPAFDRPSLVSDGGGSFRGSSISVEAVEDRDEVEAQDRTQHSPHHDNRKRLLAF